MKILSEDTSSALYSPGLVHVNQLQSNRHHGESQTMSCTFPLYIKQPLKTDKEGMVSKEFEMMVMMTLQPWPSG